MTSKTRSALTTEQTTNFADNTTGAITPVILRTTVQDMIDSTGTLLDSNAWAGSAYSFTGSVAFSGSIVSFGAQAVFSGSTSGTTTIQATGVASGTQTLQAATDTFVYLATTDTLTNKTIGSALSFAGSTSGTTGIKAIGAAGGTQTLQNATDTFVYLATTDTLTNKTINITASVNSILVNGFIPGGRLTAATGTPIMTSTVSSATSHFYTPYSGQLVPVYNGTNFIWTDTGGELSQTTADSTKSPASVATNSAYDIFVWNDSGTVRATRGKVWTSLTARADALQRINGIYTNSVAVTNGPGLNRGTYVGTIASNGSGNIDWVVGAAASGGTAASLNVWNQYNRVDVTTAVTDSGASYTYTGSSVTRQARASAGNQITFLSGNAEDGLIATYNVAGTTNNTTSSDITTGVGLDSTSTFFGQPTQLIAQTTTAVSGAQSGSWEIPPQLGRHVISANESNTNGSGTPTFDLSSKNVLYFKFKM